MSYTELNALKGYLKENKITYRDLAEKSNLSLNALNSKINGKTLFNTDEIIRICNIVGITESNVVKYFFPRMLRNAS